MNYDPLSNIINEEKFSIMQVLNCLFSPALLMVTQQDLRELAETSNVSPGMTLQGYIAQQFHVELSTK
jgi:hypothetical protein